MTDQQPPDSIDDTSPRTRAMAAIGALNIRTGRTNFNDGGVMPLAEVATPHRIGQIVDAVLAAYLVTDEKPRIPTLQDAADAQASPNAAEKTDLLPCPWSPRYMQAVRRRAAAFRERETATTPTVPAIPVDREWREAVIDALIVGHIYQAKHDTDPRQALHDLIAWEVEIALDPAVSERAAALAASPPPVGEAGVERWQHVKRGTTYEVIGRGRLQCAANPKIDDAKIVIYRGEDGQLWARGEGEFNDGRFVPLAASPAYTPRPVEGEEAVAWLYEKNGKQSLQSKRQPWNTAPDRGWTETPLYAARPVEAGAADDLPCDRCQGNGEIVTDWGEYLHPTATQPTGEEGTADCPDCCGTGRVDAGAGKLAEENARLREVLARFVEYDDDAKAAKGKGGNLNGYGLVDLFDSVGHPFGTGEHKQQPYRSVNLDVALIDARAALTTPAGGIVEGHHG